MPYIKKEDRNRIITLQDSFGGGTYKRVSLDAIETPGEMNYAITEMIINYLDRKGTSYTNMNEVVGVLECAKLELYRRKVSDYEDEKIEENGDVY